MPQGEPASQPRKGFSGYQPGCEDAVFEFQRQCYPDRVPESILPNWRWRFLDSADRLGIDPMVWLYWKGGRIVAHQGALPVRLRAGERTLTTGWFVETMASEAVRGSAIGPMLVQKALSDLPLNLSLGQTRQMRELQYALGWERVAELNTYLYVCSLTMSLRAKLPPVAAEAAAAMLGMRHARQLRRHEPARSRVRARIIDRCGPAHDALWRRMAETVTCSVVRDASYLNWKYVDRPGADFTLLEFGTGSDQDASPAALAVLMTQEPGGRYPYRRGFIVDLIAPLDDSQLIEGVLAEAVTRLKGTGAKTVTFYLSHHQLERQLLKFGFLARSPRHVLLVSTKSADDEVVKLLRAADNWYVTMGDSDADAYPG